MRSNSLLKILMLSLLAWPARAAWGQVENPHLNYQYWYRGDTHTHSNASDGSYSITELAKRYRDAGYDFLFLTDHNKVTPVPSSDGQRPLMLLRGCESGDWYENHLTALGVSTCPEECASCTWGTGRPNCSPGEDQHRVDQALASNPNAVVILAHPSARYSSTWCGTVERGWSLNKLDQVKRYHAVEINESMDEWSYLLGQGRWVFGVAANDFHEGAPSGSSILVNSSVSPPTEADLLANIRKGNFYSVICKSCADQVRPRFDSITASASELVIKGRNATTVRVVPTCGGRPQTLSFTGGSVTVSRASLLSTNYAQQHKDCFARIELEDARQNVAYSQPLRLHQAQCSESRWVSEESGVSPSQCPANAAAEGLLCSGAYCDNMKLHCAPSQSLPMEGAARAWSAWISEEAPNNQVTSTGVVTGIKCRGSYCDDVSLEFATSPALVQDSGSCYWSDWVSEEQGRRLCNFGYYASGAKCSGEYCDNLSIWCCRFNQPAGARVCGDIQAVSEEGGSPPGLCAQDGAADGLTCSGRYCDNVSLRCCAPVVPRDAVRVWSAWISEEAPNNQVTSAGVVTGIRCSGAYCDNVRLQFATSPALVQDSGSCYWSEWVSEEQGRRLCKDGYHAAGAKCSGAYCDNLALWCCRFSRSPRP